MNHCTLLLSLLLLLAPLSHCEEWYFPNSRMISDIQYKEKILNDHSTYKLVKFFTPHCQFCRYLKDVIDKLKEEKHWQFEIYDFNCAWYPAVCNEIKAYSFPFTAVFNPKGEIQTTIVGFYPYNIIKEHFQRVQESSIKFKAPKEAEQPQSVSNLGQEAHEEVKEVHEEVKEQAPPPKEEPVHIAEPQKKEEHHEQVHQQQTVISNKQAAKPQQKHQDPHLNPTPQHLSGVSQHIFYAICFFLGVVYFTHFSNPKKHHPSNPHPKINPQSPKETHHQKHTFDDMIS